MDYISYMSIINFKNTPEVRFASFLSDGFITVIVYRKVASVNMRY